MGIQKYRIDREGKEESNGSVPCYVDWIGGPTLSAVRNCPTNVEGISPRTAYISDEPWNVWIVPAKVQYKKKVYVGFLSCSDEGYVFNFYDGQPSKSQGG